MFGSAPCFLKNLKIIFIDYKKISYIINSYAFYFSKEKKNRGF